MTGLPLRRPETAGAYRYVGDAVHAIRLVIGIVFMAVALLSDLDPTIKVIAGIVGAVALITPAIRFCPLNTLLGINNCKR